MKFATCLGSSWLCLAALLAAQAFGQTTSNTTPEAQKAAAQLSQPAGPPQLPQADTANQPADHTTIAGYGPNSSNAADTRPAQPIYQNSAAMGAGPMPMRVTPMDSTAMTAQHDTSANNSANGQQRGEIGVWLIENGGEGVRVARLVRGGAADQAGLKSGDIVTQVNGNNVSSPRTAAQQIRGIPIGQQAMLTVMRDGSQQQLQVTLAAARPGQSYQVGYGGENGDERSMTSGDRDGNGLAARTARLEQQMQSMTEELHQMREQMSSMRTSSAGSSSTTGIEQPANGALSPNTSSPTSTSATPPQPTAGSATSSSTSSTTPAPTPAAGSSPSSTDTQDLFGGSSSSSTTPASGATK
ncbi:MAG TPA: PDZ domain-containing protein [Lacipirellulaceae bacterium]|jgi:hypothetical protein|nr:PDZ domain-containing protein [Lacipirellulaceae bacterium]